MLNIGIVRAFGKQDLAGAAEAWQQVVDIAPDSRRRPGREAALEAVRSAHPEPRRRRAAKPQGTAS